METEAKTVQAILRHANVSTTMAHYVVADPAEQRSAMAKLDGVLDSIWSLAKGGQENVKSDRSHNIDYLSRGLVAQRLEQRTHNPLVPGSNPGGPTTSFQSVRAFLRHKGKFPRRSIGQRTVWALLIVVTSPLLDLRLCIGQIEEHFHVQAFVPQSAVEALDVAVLHRLAGTNEIQFHSYLMSPVVHRLPREF